MTSTRARPPTARPTAEAPPTANPSTEAPTTANPSAEALPAARPTAEAPLVAGVTRAGSAMVVSASMRELLTWIGREPRTYASAMDAWRSSCPRFSVWEDALDAELIAVEPANGGGADNARVRLTARGQAVVH